MHKLLREEASVQPHRPAALKRGGLSNLAAGGVCPRGYAACRESPQQSDSGKREPNP